MAEGSSIGKVVTVVGVAAAGVIAIGLLSKQKKSAAEQEAKANILNSRANANLARSERKGKRNDAKVRKKNLKQGRKEIKLMKKARRSGVKYEALNSQGGDE